MRALIACLWLLSITSAQAATEYCVGTLTQLKQAFVSAQSDGEASVIKVREGVYVLDEDISYGEPDGREDGTLTLRGGYSGATCLFQTPTPLNTTIAGTTARSLSLTNFIGMRVEYLSFVGPDVNLGGCPPVFSTCALNVNRIRAQTSRMTIDLAGGSGLLRDSLFITGRDELALVVNVREVSDSLPLGAGPFRLVNVSVVDALTRFGGGDLNDPDDRLVDVRNSSFSRSGAIEIETNRDMTINFSRYDSFDANDGAVLTASNNTNAQPNFNAQFIPNPGSPLIDRGTASVEGGLSRDVYNEPRVVGQSVDIGAAESPVDGSGVFVVDTIASSGAGSLAAAVAFANADDAANLIRFNIPGGCPKRITRTSALVVTDGLTIDGYSQPGSSMNSSSTNFNGEPCIILDGANRSHDGIVAGAALSTKNEGLRIRGLAFEDFATALNLDEGLSHIIQGNQFGGIIGSSSDPASALSSNNNAISLGRDAAQFATIGGDADNETNLLVGSNLRAVTINRSSNNTISNNQIGYDRTGPGASSFSNGTGVQIQSAANNLIVGNRFGGNDDGVRLLFSGARNNRIQNNAFGGFALNEPPANIRFGVQIFEDAHDNRVGPGNTFIGNEVGVRINETAGGRNRVDGNGFGAQTGLGIDLGLLGVTPNSNDPSICDQTLGCASNGEQNFPVLTQARFITGVTPVGRPLQVAGSLRSLVRSTPYTVEFFASASCDASGHGEGERRIDSINVTITNSGICSANNCTASFSTFIAAENVVPNEYLTATATTPNGDTSEFSACVRIAGPNADFANGFE
jgi:hypothetical protein